MVETGSASGRHWNRQCGPKRRGLAAAEVTVRVMIVHLVDGTYELFRHFYGLRRFNKGKDRPLGAVVGVLQSVLEIIERGETHVGVATDHVIESFRNDLWPGYKTSAGIEPALWAQFHPLEDALAAMGVVVWPMVELEADDALASAAQIASADRAVQKVCIWTPDKDLAQCVVADRVVQVDRKAKTIRDEAGVRAKFGVRAEPHPRLPRARRRRGRRLSRASPASAPSAPRGCWTVTGRSSRFRARCSAIASSSRCSSSASRRCAATPSSSTTWRRCAGAARPLAFAAWTERAGAPRLLERCLAAAQATLDADLEQIARQRFLDQRRRQARCLAAGRR